MQIQVGDIFTTRVYTGEFWYVKEVLEQFPHYCKYQKIVRIPPLKYFDVDEVMFSIGKKSLELFLDLKKFRPVKLGGEVKNEKLYLRCMELLLKMDKLRRIYE